MKYIFVTAWSQTYVLKEQEESHVTQNPESGNLEAPHERPMHVNRGMQSLVGKEQEGPVPWLFSWQVHLLYIIWMWL